MPYFQTTRIITAPPAEVFDAVAHIESFQKVVPHIVRVEFLSEIRRGKGARFKETRVMGKREATTELEVTEYVESERVRMVSEAGGTTWDTVFTVKPQGEQTEMKMVMDATPHNVLARLFNPLLKRVVAKAIAQDMDAVKTYCETPR